MGVIAIFVIIFVYIAKGISDYSYKVDAIKRSRENGNYKTYVDINGMMRFQKNDKAISTRYDLKTGDLLSWNPETGEIYENLTKKHHAELIKKGLPHAEGYMVPYNEPYFIRNKAGKAIWGKIYYNLKNKCLYVKRNVQDVDVFLNCETNLFEKINCDELPELCLRHNEYRRREKFKSYTENWFEGYRYCCSH